MSFFQWNEESYVSEQRKKIILNEIAFWKQNKLLPEHYCDFLITLYAQGEMEGQNEQLAQHSILQKKKSKLPVFLLLGGGMLTTFIIASLFLGSNVVVPIVLAILAIIFFLVFAIRNKKSSTIKTILLILTALILLAVSFKCWESYFPESSTALLLILIANCLSWLAAGFWLKLIYFTISGILGGIVIFIYTIVLFT